MRLIDVMITMEADGVIRIPRTEMKMMGLMEGDQVCLSYLTRRYDSTENQEKEFMIEKIYDKKIKKPEEGYCCPAN